MNINISNETKYKNELINIIKKYLPDCKIYLFGSRARKEHRLNSDIDIAINCNKKIEHIFLAQIRNDLDESNIPFLVDVVDFQTVALELQKNILAEGIIWKS
ncbi:nucleotidyltransferase domain-containing protein [Candidatus Babeliales bacterium]|nr:nucleotidyltransferase domain-containing protein [Candidatus Babeliales bacterium]MCF7899835.1 nucleotidyltransferase domain-containing protein [Candidatus Babeliales bacterium]